MELRPHQRPAIQNVIKAWKAGTRRQLISMATGTGKTIVAAHIIAQPSLPQSRVLILAHREELINQAVEKFQTINKHNSITVEKAERKANETSEIVVASVASLCRNDRLNRVIMQDFGICIVDEAHHATSPIYRKILEALRPNCLIIGLTATPNRADGEPLSKVFDEIVYDYSLRQAITDGVLCDLTGIRVDTDISLDHVKRTAGDFQQDQLAAAVNTESRNQLIVKSWIEHASDRRTIAFCVDIAHSLALAEAFRDQGVNAAAIWGTDEDRQNKIRLHKEGRITVLCNCAVLTEGYDDPGVACVLLARPTQSALMFTQMIGRGTRLGKPNCLVLDVVDNCRKHDITTLPSLLGLPRRLNLRGNSIIQAARDIESFQQENPDVDLSELQDISKMNAFVEQFDVLRKTAASFPQEVLDYSNNAWHRAPGGGLILTLPGKQRVTIVKNLLNQYVVNGFTTETFQFVDKNQQSAIERADSELAFRGLTRLTEREAKWKKKKATEKQLALIYRLYPGRSIPKDLTAGEASNLISKKAATWKQ